MEMSGELATMLDAPIDPRSIPTRFSLLKLMALSPAHYYAACQRDEDDQTIALRLGSGVHAIVLGEPVIRFSGRRAGKAWEAFAADHADKTILNDREWVEAQSMASAILRRREAMEILFYNTIVEQRIDWTFLGRACRSTPDARGPYHVAELKTCRTSNPTVFIRDAMRMFYPSQLAFYQDAIGHAEDVTPEKAYIVAVEKSDPYPVTILELTERALEQGRRVVRLWFEQLLNCEASSEWPEYAASIVPFDVPDWEPAELIVNGERMEID